MEKNGNTFAPGDKVAYSPSGVKQAADQEGEVLNVDPSGELLHVRWTQTGGEEWLPVGAFTRA